MRAETKERPILFSGGMVRAILDGRKTQTRRVIKPQPTEFGLVWRTACDGEFGAWEDDGLLLDEGKQRTCPYGQPGDRLYVRETWKTGKRLDHLSPLGIEQAARDAFWTAGPFCPLWYPADDSYRRWGDNDENNFGCPGKVRSSIHMPRWASRILLEITDVRAERLQDISERDAEKEGYKRIPVAGWEYQGMQTAAESFLHGEWAQAIQEKHGNPWVWVIEFKRVKP